MRDLLVNPNPIAPRARLLRGLSPCLCRSSTPCAMDPLSLWEQHPVRDLLVNPNPYRAQGAAPTGRLLLGGSYGADRAVGSAADDAAQLGA